MINGYGIAVDSSGYAYITGRTDSTDFGTASAYQGTYGGGTWDAFITKITSSSVAAPTVTTGSATDITGNTATLNSTVNANGDATTAWFDYGTSSGVYTGTSTGQSVSGTSTTSVSIGINSLTQSTTYYYVIVASNSYGTSTGSEASFATYGTPTVITSSATSITSSSATLNSTVNANGTSTTAWFEYGGTSGSYTGTSSTQSVSGTSNTSVSASLSGLSSSTPYYYRAAAQNSIGTSYGSETSFPTSSPPPDTGGGVTNPAPTYISVNSVIPASGATNVSTGATISATFSDTINGDTVSSDTFKVTTGGSGVSGALSTSGSTATFTPSSGLSYNTTYTATLTTGIKAANASQSSLSSNYSWSFTTASPVDSDPPSGSVVINNGNEYATSAEVTLSLSATDDIGVTGYYLATGSSTPSAPDSGWVAATSAATFSGSVSYILSTGDGVKTLYAFYKDNAGNISAAASDSITLDATPPAINTTEPANNATGVAIDVILTATFSEGMDASTIGTSTFTFENLNVGTVNYSGTSTTATVTFIDTLQYYTTYNGTITTGVKDIAGNAMASDYGWRFTTVGETTGTATPAPSPTGTITPSVTPTPVSTGYGAISGIVANEITGIAIAGATVETDVGGYGTTTGSDGRFLVSDIPAGEYLITASAEDYNPASETITVENSGTSSVSFSLIPSFLAIPTPSPAVTITPSPSLSPSPVPSPTPTGKPLEAGFTASPVTGKKPLTVQFADASTGNIKSWKWDFGDGEASTEQNPSHTYQKKGNYTVSLKVKGKDGSTDTESKANYITVLKEDEILADFTADTTSGLPPLEVQFTEQCFGEITSYRWDFGDGSTSSEQNPKLTYTASGEYTASLTVKGAGNISDTETKEGYITVEKKISEITLEISNAELSFGSFLALSGQTTPAFETTVTLAFTHNNGETDTETVASDENGVYTLNEYFPPSGGTWDITASWGGNEEYKGAESSRKAFTVSQAEADFTIEASAYETEIGKTVDITGVITLTPDNETTRSKFLEEKLKLIRINPDEEYEDVLETQPFLSDNNQLQYSFSGVALSVIGEWEILAGYDETESFKRKRSESINVTVKDAAKEVAGYAIIVQGRVKGESGIEEHNRTTNYVYNRLKDRGFTDDNIYYFNYNKSQDGVDAKPSPTGVTKLTQNPPLQG